MPGLTIANAGLIGGLNFDPGVGLRYVGGTRQGFEGSTSDLNVSLTSLTDGISSAPIQNDIVIVAFATNPDDTGQISYRLSGYTEITDLYVNDTERVQLQVGYKIMGATPDTSVTITGGTADGDQAGAVAVHVWRGVDISNPANPFDATATTFTSLNTAIPNPPSIQPVTSNAVVLAVGAGGHNDGTDTFSSSGLSNFISIGANDTHDVTIGLGSISWSGSGAVDPAQFGFSGSDNTAYAAAAVTIALKPA